MKCSRPEGRAVLAGRLWLWVRRSRGHTVYRETGRPVDSSAFCSARLRGGRGQFSNSGNKVVEPVARSSVGSGSRQPAEGSLEPVQGCRGAWTGRQANAPAFKSTPMCSFNGRHLL